MKIEFLGTGAADWLMPLPGDEKRFLTSTLIDGELLVDLGLDGDEKVKDTSVIKNILITHSHRDHFNAECIAKLAPVNLYIDAGWADTVQLDGVNVLPVEPGERFQAGNHMVTAAAANHSTSETGERTLHYLIERDNKRLYYATDGAWLLYNEMTLLKENPVDAIVMDATIGDGHEGDFRVFEHNSLPMVRIMVNTLRSNDMLKKDGPVFLTHLARTLHAGQAELEKANPAPYVVCKDGLQVEI